LIGSVVICDVGRLKGGGAVVVVVVVVVVV